jgi:antitoxin HicB
MNHQHLGSNFDDFLQGEQLLGDAEAAALKRVIAFQIAQEMKRRDKFLTIEVRPWP